MLEHSIYNRARALRALRDAGVTARESNGRIYADAPSDCARHLRSMAGHMVHCTQPPTRVANRAKSRSEKLADGKIKRVLDKLDLTDAERTRAQTIIAEEIRPALIKRFELILARIGMLEGSEDTPEGDITGSVSRLNANVAALNLAAATAPGATLTDAERKVLLRYTGFAGLTPGDDYYDGTSLNPDIVARLPEGVEYDMFGLLNEFYTPSSLAEDVWKAIKPLAKEFRGDDGRIRALEPSVGIGRFVEPTIGEKIDWTLVEQSAVSALLAERLYPNAEFYRSSFQKAAHTNDERWKRHFNLVLANPPYSKGGDYILDDPNSKTNREFGKNAYLYFVLRTAEFLAKDGLMVQLIPETFLNSTQPEYVKARKQFLRQTHLAAAYFMPSGIFVGSGSPTVLVIGRGRGGMLPEVLKEDQFIVEGDYFEKFPKNVLGKLVVDPDAFRYRRQVVGDYTGLPKIVQRPMKGAKDVIDDTPVKVTVPKKKRTAKTRETMTEDARKAIEKLKNRDAQINRALKKKKLSVDDRNALLAEQRQIPKQIAEIENLELFAWTKRAVQIGDRVVRYRNRLKTGSVASLAHARAQYPELRKDVDDWLARPAGKTAKNQLKELADLGMEGASIALAWSEAGVSAGFDPPSSDVKTNPTSSVIELAAQLYRLKTVLRLRELRDAARRNKLKAPTVEDLVENGFAVDVLAHTGDVKDARGETFSDALVMPIGDYVAGETLWDRFDAVDEFLAMDISASDRAALGVQRTALTRAIDPATFEEIDVVDPREPWVPARMVLEWYRERRMSWSYEYEPKNGYEYEGIKADEIGGQRIYLYNPAHSWGDEKIPRGDRCILGFLNNDRNMWNAFVPQNVGSSAKDQRLKITKMYLEDFQNWLSTSEKWQPIFVEQYNRTQRGFSHPKYSPEMPYVERWGGDITLYAHQAEGANRCISQNGGLLAFDVGVGKTFTLAAIIAIMRQRGSRRPYFILPNSLLLKWKKEIARCLPDYSICIIGMREYLGRGGVIRMTTDDSDERIEKNEDFRDGLYDIAFCAESAFQRTPAGDRLVKDYLNYAVNMRLGTQLVTDNVVEWAPNRDDRALLAEKAADGFADVLIDKETTPKKERSARQIALDIATIRQTFAQRLLPPSDRPPDTGGPTFEELGVDLFGTDEAHEFKNLHLAPQRTDYGEAKYMGGSGHGSGEAFSFDIRAFATRQRNGAVVLLTATPAKNSPLELYNLLQYINPDWFVRRGVQTPEQFLMRYVDLARKTTLNAEGKVVERLVVSNFRNLPSLRQFLFRYADFRNAETVGLDVPDGVKHIEYTERSEAQTAKIRPWRDWIEEIKRTASTEEDERMAAAAAMVSLQRQQEAAVHPFICPDPKIGAYEFDDGENEKKAKRDAAKQLKKTKAAIRNGEIDWRDSPKLAGCAGYIAKNLVGGHIIFCDVVAAHPIIELALVESGIPADRIAILNAATAPNAKKRQDVVDRYNGDEDEKIDHELDVLICNRIAEQGMDIQVRTQAIHHLDLPWTPASLQQRNGRGVRQGNKHAKENNGNKVDIFYWMTKRSADGYRLDMLAGKSSWLNQIVYSESNEVNNPAGEGDLGQFGVILATVEDETEAQAMLAAYKETLEAKVRADSRNQALRLWKQTVGYARAARKESDPSRVQILREKAQKQLDRLAQFDQTVWRHHRAHEFVFDLDMTVPFGAMGPVVAAGQWTEVQPEPATIVNQDGKDVSPSIYRRAKTLSFRAPGDVRPFFVERVIDGRAVTRPLGELIVYPTMTGKPDDRKQIAHYESYIDSPWVKVVPPPDEQLPDDALKPRSYSRRHPDIEAARFWSDQTWDLVETQLGEDAVKRWLFKMNHRHNATSGVFHPMPVLWRSDLYIAERNRMERSERYDTHPGGQIIAEMLNYGNPQRWSDTERADFKSRAVVGFEKGRYYAPLAWQLAGYGQLGSTRRSEMVGGYYDYPPDALAKIPKHDDLTYFRTTVSGYLQFLDKIGDAQERYSRKVLQDVSKYWFGLGIPSAAWEEGSNAVRKPMETSVQ